jgi:hypothetical protein
VEVTSAGVAAAAASAWVGASKAFEGAAVAEAAQPPLHNPPQLEQQWRNSRDLGGDGGGGGSWAVAAPAGT